MKLKELYRLAKEQGRQDVCRFMRDMRRAGLKMEFYRGRFFWAGPAVVCHGLQDVLSNTKVPCQHDSMGLDVVVYPRESVSVPREGR
jgi:hypothetical protein